MKVVKVGIAELFHTLVFFGADRLEAIKLAGQTDGVFVLA